MSILRSNSAQLYEKKFKEYLNYCTAAKTNLETSMFDYDVVVLSKIYKPTTIQSVMSMIKQCMIDRNKKLETEKAQLFLRKLHATHSKKKTNVFTVQEVNMYMKTGGFVGKELQEKIAVQLALYGALRIKELTNLMIQDVNIEESEMTIKVTQSKTDKSKQGFYFVIPDTKEEHSTFKLLVKYLNSLPVQSGRRFRRFVKDKFTKAHIGKNTLGSLPRRMAQRIGKKDPKSFTGHALKRKATTWMADAGCSILDLMRFGRWKSYNVARGYVEKSMKFKREMATRMLTVLKQKLKTNSTESTKKQQITKVVHIYNNSGPIHFKF